HGTLATVLASLELPADGDLLDDIVTKSSFEFRTGRQRGEEAKGRFDRKGVAGDWVNHFSDEDKARFKAIAGDLLITLGYEKDDDW
ncbi:MAG: sulfotransferase domain-containing protein, partial [Pseudomonadota bacterium]